MHLRSALTLSALLALGIAPLVYAKAPVKVETVAAFADGAEPAWFKTVLTNGGKMDDATVAAMVADYKRQVLADLAKRGVPADPAFLKALEADSELHDSVFIAISPADSRVFENLQRLHRELGPLYPKYRHLAMGAAMLRREVGVGEVYAPVNNFKHTQFFQAIAPAKAAGKSPEQFLAEPREERKKGDDDSGAPLAPAVIAAVDKFKSENANLPLNEIWAKPELRAALVKRLEAAGIPAKSAPATLGRWMVAKKIRPERRSNAPSVAEYIKALAKRYETPASAMNLGGATDGKGKQPLTWPMFPVDKAPWPVLMGLGLTWPLDESQYIFEKLRGKHGDRRLHTYGPYRMNADDMTVDSLREIPWAPHSWISQSYVGGVCGTMATLAAGTWVSLGVPMYKTGQPGHGNLLTYRANPDGSFYARVEQSASAGPDGTYTEWPFHDQAHPRTFYAECHYGLALAMNRGLPSWLKTRAALHAFHLMRPELRATTGRALLLDAVKANPFNAELWYYLGDTAPDWPAKRELLTLLHTAITGDAALAAHRLRDVTADLGEEREESADLTKQVVQFRTLVRDVLLREDLGNPAELTVPQRRELLAMTQPWSAQNTAGLTEIKARYELSLTDPAQYMGDIKTKLTALISGTAAPAKGKGKSRGPSEGDIALQVKQIAFVVTDAPRREAFLKELLDTATPANAVVTKKDKRQLRPAFDAVADALADSYKESGRGKDAKALRQRIAELTK